ERLKGLADAVDRFECSDLASTRYRIRMKLVAMSSATVRKFGLDIEHAALLPQASDPWSVILKQLGSSEDVRLIGEPSLLVQKGSSAKMTSGGEFRVFYDSSGAKGTIKEGWKQYGLTF